MSRSSNGWRRVTAAALICGALASIVTTSWVVAGVVDTLQGTSSAPWMLARASGFTSYILMMSLVLMGLLLSHPAAVQVGWPSRIARVRIHVALAVFTGVFIALYVIVLATDPWAGVGWPGALLPMASDYRPIPVTLGVIALWSAAVTALTASLAGRLLGRLWWPIHKVAGLAFILVWAHALFSGTDTPALAWFYLTTGMLILLVGLSRYTTRSASDDLEDLVTDRERHLTGSGRRTL